VWNVGSFMHLKAHCSNRQRPISREYFTYQTFHDQQSYLFRIAELDKSAWFIWISFAI